MKKLPLFLRSFRAKVMLFFVLAMVFAGATSNLIIYHYALDAQFEQLRGKLMAIAQTSAPEPSQLQLLGDAISPLWLGKQMQADRRKEKGSPINLSSVS